MKTTDVDFSEQRVSVIIPDTKTYTPRSFVITRPDWIEILRQYMKLRMEVELGSDRFMLQFRYGKLTKQPLGHNSISKYPQKIAQFLNLSNIETYTGHCFRRTAATLLASTGADVLQLKRLGGWKSSSVAEGYVDASLEGQVRIAELLTASNPIPRRNIPSTISRPPASPSTSFVAAPTDVLSSSMTGTSATRESREYNFTKEEIKQGLYLTINTHDQSNVVINFNKISSNNDSKTGKDDD